MQSNAEKIADYIEWAESREQAAADLRSQIEASHPAMHFTLERTLAYHLSEAAWARAEAAKITGDLS